MENAGARPVASGPPFCPTVMTCPLCTRPLEPVLDREDYRFARCVEGGQVYLVGAMPAGVVVLAGVVRNPSPQASQLHSWI